MADDTKESKAPPIPDNRAVSKELVKVRVIGTQPINERGSHYAPKSKRIIKGVMTEIPADTFETTRGRAAALGEHVEVIED